MTQDRAQSRFEELRAMAEGLLRTRPDSFQPGEDNFLEVLHELKVHQMELEIQNEELREAQDEISRLHREYADLYEHAPCGYVTISPEMIITRINLTGTDLLGVNRSTITRMALSVFLSRESEDPYIDALRNSRNTGRKQHLELRLRPNGESESRWVQADIDPEFSDAGNLIQWRMSMTEITEQKKLEEELDKRLQEQALLIREVHHRIKNNLSVVYNMFAIQSGSVTNQEAKAILKQAMSRMGNMTTLYDLLLGVDQHTTISTRIYIETMIASIRDLHGNDDRIEINTRIDDVPLAPGILSEIGMMINELITNSYKYAFPGERPGRIEVSVIKDASRVGIIVQDDGIGLPDGFDPEASGGMGLMLVRMLSRQNHGSFSIEDTKGTRCTCELEM